MKRADAPVGGIGDTAPSPDRGNRSGNSSRYFMLRNWLWL
jgi:hypothetical protein